MEIARSDGRVVLTGSSIQAPALIGISGRLGVGKTFLVTELWPPDRHTCYYLASRSTPSLIRAEFTHELARWSERSLDMGPPPTWEEIFRTLGDLAKKAPLTVVIDDAQNLIDSDGSFADALVSFWSGHTSTTLPPLTLVLCGVAENELTQTAPGDQPLQTLPIRQIDLQPLDYLAVASLLPGRTVSEILTLYGAFGGMPGYLALVPPDRPVDQVLIDLIIDPEGPVRQKIERLMEQEFTGREESVCPAILSVIATGDTTLDAMSERTGLVTRAVLRALNTLEKLGLVGFERAFQASVKHPWRARILDNAIHFYYRFVHPNRSRLATDPIAGIWKSSIAPQLDDYVGQVFDDVAKQALARHYADWSLDRPVDIGTWVGLDRNGVIYDFDLVASLEGERILTGQVNWSTEPIGIGVHRNLVYDVESLARSGIPWAVAAGAPETSAGQLYVSAGGFTDELLTFAERNAGIHLVTLDDLYRQPADP